MQFRPITRRTILRSALLGLAGAAVTRPIAAGPAAPTVGGIDWTQYAALRAAAENVRRAVGPEQARILYGMDFGVTPAVTAA